VKLAARGDDRGMVVRVRAFPILDDGQGPGRRRKTAIELVQTTDRLVQHIGERVSADEIKPAEPQIGPRLDRLAEPLYRLFVVAGEKMRAPDDPVKNGDRGVVRAEPDRLLDKRRRFLRAADESQLVALVGVG